jgi:hypothetical protein
MTDPTSALTRYDLEYDEGEQAWIGEDPEGRYVRLDDVRALLSAAPVRENKVTDDTMIKRLAWQTGDVGVDERGRWSVEFDDHGLADFCRALLSAAPVRENKVTDTTNALLPCPFCSWRGELNHEGEKCAWVECIDCAAQGPMEANDETAITAWNRRAVLSAAPGISSGGMAISSSGSAAPVELVEYQRRMRPTWLNEGEGWSEWEKCSEGVYEDTLKLGTYNDWQYEARALYAAPLSPAPDDIAMLRREIHNLKRHIEDYCPAPDDPA